MALPVLWDPELCAAEIRRVAKKGCHSDHLHREPGGARAPELPRRALGPDVARARGRGDDPQRPPRLVGSACGHRARRADGRDDHAPADEHLRGGRRPRVVAHLQGVPRSHGRALGRRYGLDPVLPRPARPHLRHAPPVDRAKTSATASRPTSSGSTSSRASSPIPIGVALRHEIGVDNICWEQDYPHSDSSWPTAPEELHRVATKYDGAGRRAQQDHVRERDALVPLRSVRAPAEGAVHGRRAARGSRRSRRDDPPDGQGPLRERRAGVSLGRDGAARRPREPSGSA